MAMKARKRSELHILKFGWVSGWYIIVLEPFGDRRGRYRDDVGNEREVSDEEYHEYRMFGRRLYGCLSTDRGSGWTPAFPSLASCVISVVVSPAIPEVAGNCADGQLIDKPIGD